MKGNIMNTYQLTDTTQLEELYGDIAEASIKKEVDYLHPRYQEIIKASPFFVLASHGPDGLDTSPRGDAPGFVEILDEKTLVIPDRRGNNRLDSLRNIIHNPQVALLFFVPGLGETLRVIGNAIISVDPILLQRHSIDNKAPKTVLIIQVKSVFFQCSRAIRRSNLWQLLQPVDTQLPSPGRILAELTSNQIDGEKYDRELPERIKNSLY
jgi:uncharacterized protein